MEIDRVVIAIGSLIMICLIAWCLFTRPKHGSALYILQCIAEAFIFLAPGAGLLLSANKCQEHPFDLDSLATPWTLWILFSLAFFISKFFRSRLSPLALLMLSLCLFGGFLYCLIICIHFVPLGAMLLFPFYNILFLSPLFCGLKLLAQLRQLNLYFKSLDQTAGKLSLLLSKDGFRLLLFLLLPFTVVLQALLYLFGQKPDSLIRQFSDSCGFLLSSYQQCACGGGHYLCSVAANGNARLVKPFRYGLRANQRILVNRQLLVANAFEHWLEAHCPRIHRPIRRFYDSLGIPVNRWSKKRKLANGIYLLMKPLEFFFLLWLYLFDKHPENRIAQQYLPKKELQEFLNQRS